MAHVARGPAAPPAGAGWRRARGATLERNSPTSRTFAAKAAERLSPRSQPSSFRCDPQPDELTTTRSTPSSAPTSSVASSLPSSSRPACTEGAAASLWRRQDVEPVRGEHSGGGGVHVGEDRPLDAPGQEPDAPARLPHGERERRDVPSPRQRGAISTRARNRLGMGIALPRGASAALRASAPDAAAPGTATPRTSRSPRGRSYSSSTAARVVSIRRS